MRPADEGSPSRANPSSALHSLVEQFEGAWQAGRRPDLAAYLPPGTARRAALVELAHVDLERRLKAGEAARVEDYLRRYPELADDRAFLLEFAAAEYRLRRRAEPGLTAEEFARRFPALCEHLTPRLMADTPEPVGVPPTRPEGPAVPSTRIEGPEMPPGTPPAPAPGADHPQRVGRYEIEGEIARGGMGVVWRARDRELGRPLALKVLGEQHRGRPELARRFREEAQITGQLQHPGIPPVHEVGTLPDGRPFFAMKLVKGRTLNELLRERSSPADDLPRFLGVFEQVCQTLAYAHSRAVLHRDLKPANVMVGAFGEVQVMDWGLAKVLRRKEGAGAGEDEPGTVIGSAADPSPGTWAGAVLGTPAYMAPEQARGEVDELDERCDVFGLGAILCVVLTGQPPFLGARAQAQAGRGDLGGARNRLDACGADGELVRLARRCLAAEKGERPRAAAEVAQVLGAYLAGVQERLREAERRRAAAEARAEEALARAKAERRARRSLLGLAVAALLLVLAGGGGAWRLQQQRAAARARRSQTDQEASAALGRARGLLDEGWQAHDRTKLAEAKAEADRAADVARNGDASAAVREQAAAFQAEVGERLGRAEKTLALLGALQGVSAPQARRAYNADSPTWKALALSSLDEHYAASFRRWWGLDVDRTPGPQLVERFRREPEVVVQGLVAALDVWVLERRMKGPEARWRRLVELAEQLDRDGRRRQLRALLVEGAAPRAESVAGLFGAGPPWPALWGLAGGDRWSRLREWRRRVDGATAPTLTVVLLALACRSAGDEAGARGVLRQAVAARPDDVLLLGALGQLLEWQGPARLGEAIECYRAVRARRPHLGLPLGLALVKAGRAAEGEAVLRDLARRQPNDPEVWADLGIALHGQGKLEGAVGAWRTAVRLDPAHARAHYNLGVALYRQGKPEEAEAAWRTAVRVNPEFAEAYGNLGNALWARGQAAEAEAACRTAIRLNPDLPEAHVNLGTALTLQGKLAEAEAAFRAAVRLDPGLAVAFVNLGVALNKQGKWGEAEAAWRTAIRLDPGAFEPHYNLGSLLHRRKNLAEAVGAYRVAVRLNPKHAGAWFDLGRALHDQGKAVEAEAACRAALRLEPDFAQARANLGATLYAQGKWVEAEAACRAAIRLDPGLAEAHVGLGHALFAQKKPAEAEAAYRTAFRLKPEHPGIDLALGMVLWEQARFEEALAALKKGSARLPPGSPVREQVRQLIDQCQRQAKRDGKLTAVLRGAEQPADAAEQIEFGRLCALKKLDAAAARFYRAAFAADPRRAEAVPSGTRYAAACAAALAGCGQGKDADELDDAERARWRRQALDWLRLDLTWWGQALADGKAQADVVLRQLRSWQAHADLAGVRDRGSLAKLPDGERKEWEKLWADVAALLQRADRTR